MPDKSPLSPRALLVRLLCVCVCVCALGGLRVAHAQTAPVLLSDSDSTRAVALESVSFKREPFSVSTDIAWHTDRRTRVMLFAMNLELLPGEGANALMADAQDATGRLHPLAVEYVGRVRGEEWMHAVVVRLSDEMTDSLGDVLVRVSLHGVASNRVRIAIGQAGGGPPDDPGAKPTSAPPTRPPVVSPTPLPTYGPGGASVADTVRFLEQSSWGPNASEVERVRAMGLRAYLNEQFNAPASGYPSMTLMPQDINQGCPDSVANDPAYNRGVCQRMNYSMYPLQIRFFRNAIYGQDQLRQRVAFALHQILTVSGRDITLSGWMSPYLQTLDRNAFGNYRQLLEEIALNPAMGRYLDTTGNTRQNPNENFAREILQLFSVGVDELNADGTPKLDAQGNRIPTYTQETVNNFTRVFTGWNFAAPKQTVIDGVSYAVLNYQDSLVPLERNHDQFDKTLLNYPGAPGVNLPAGQSSAADLQAALDNIFNHPNVGPFVGKQLIQHLVTSNPSPAYVARVAAAFNNNCAGLYPESCTNARGDLKATVRAVLLDPEARGDLKTDPSYGRLREPAQFVAGLLRMFDAKSFDKTTQSDGYHQDTAAALDQDIFRPPTVFSYYQPDYQVPGTKILGPPFGILSASTSLRRANWVNTILHTGILRSTPNGGDPGNRPQGTSLDLSAFQQLAAQPDLLINELDRLMLHNTMSSAMRLSVNGPVANVPASNPITSAESQKCAQMAIYLVATSPQYQVQR